MSGPDARIEDDRGLVGRMLASRWHVVALLGRGGMCRVYEAREADGTRVALKLLDPDLARTERARARFLREGRVANAVGHPGAVRVLDSHVSSDDELFLVMELLEGQTLQRRRIAAGGRLPEREALHVAERVLEVLAAAHAKAIFHRDIKPDNIFLTSDGQVKILDFGIAAVRDDAEDGAITQSGVSLGTPAFMAPEQARGRHSSVDARTDIWAVGATLFACLAGRHVHGDAATANEAIIFSATQSAPRIGKFCPELSPGIASVVDRALALDPAARWSTASAMREALTLARTLSSDAAVVPAALHPTSSSIDSEAAAPGRHSPNRRIRAWLVATATLGGLVIAGEVAVRLHTTPQPLARAPKDPVATEPATADAGPPQLTAAGPVADAPRAIAPAAQHARLARSADPKPTGIDSIPDAVLDRRK